MAKTTTGLPYPVPTDPIAQGADAIKLLAEGIDKHIQSGVFSYVTAANGLFTVTFPVAFTSPPAVVAIPQAGTGYSWTVQLNAGLVTATSFGGVLWRAGVAPPAGTTVPIHWIAIGVIP